MSKPAQERRQIPRRKDSFYRFILSMNVLAWLILIAALVMFHFARPDFISGVQSYWGIEGQTEWSPKYASALRWLLRLCVVFTFLSMTMRLFRNRRQGDHFGVNLFILGGIAVISLVALIATLE